MVTHALTFREDASYHGIFLSGNRRAEGNLIFGRAFTLIQHIFKLFLRIALKSHELESESIALIPPNHSEGDDDRRPSSGRLHMETQTRSDRVPDVALDLTSGKREIHHGPMT
jgi:hypothetical protein